VDQRGQARLQDVELVEFEVVMNAWRFFKVCPSARVGISLRLGRRVRYCPALHKESFRKIVDFVSFVSPRSGGSRLARSFKAGIAMP
jgi:hypothetical protein